MQWHTDRFTVPAGGVELARNDVGPQAFRLRHNLAVQFHPEIDETTIRSWLDMGGEEARSDLAAAGGTVDTLLADTRANRDRARVDVRQLVGRFLACLEGPEAAIRSR